MPKEYRTIEKVAGPITLIHGAQGVTHDEIRETELVSDGRCRCKVLKIDGGNVMVQLYEASTSINLDPNKVRFLGCTMELGVSEDTLSRMFDGVGKPIDGGPDIPPERRMDINGLPMNLAAKSYPEEFIRTGASAIDGLNTLARGQELPTFSASGFPHASPATQIARQAKVCDADESFAVVFAAADITFEKASSSMENFRETGIIGRSIMLINLTNGPVVRRIATPRMALTAAKCPVFKKNVCILVTLTDVTNYIDSLREISAARREVSGRRGYPGYVYTNLASLYERAGRRKGKNGSITMIPILTTLEDDKTHSIPDLTGYITGGQIILNHELYRKNVILSISVLSFLSRLKDKGIDEGKTCVGHADVTNQLFAAYTRGRDVKELMTILGEAALIGMDKLCARFANEFEKEYVSQGCYAGRDIEETMEVGWELLCTLPRSELKCVKDEFLDLYCEAK